MPAAAAGAGGLGAPALCPKMAAEVGARCRCRPRFDVRRLQVSGIDPRRLRRRLRLRSLFGAAGSTEEQQQQQQRRAAWSRPAPAPPPRSRMPYPAVAPAGCEINGLALATWLRRWLRQRKRCSLYSLQCTRSLRACAARRSRLGGDLGRNFGAAPAGSRRAGSLARAAVAGVFSKFRGRKEEKKKKKDVDVIKIL